MAATDALPRAIGADQSLQQIRSEFFKIPGGCLAILAAIHVLPKQSLGPELRLGMTIAYFGAALVFLYHMTTPLEQYLQKLYRWRYEDCGPALEKSWQLYLHSLGRVTRVVAYVLLAFVGSTALWVLQAWPQFHALDALSELTNTVWWLSLAGLPLFAFAGDVMISETLQRYHLLGEQIATSGYTPRNLKDLEKHENAPPRRTVEAVRDYEFHAGGMDWSWEDFYKNCIVFGQSGTGKTVCVLNALVDGMLASTCGLAQKPSALILDPKGDFHRKIHFVCEKYGRGGDLVVLDVAAPENSIRWNPFDSDDDELELSSRFAAVLESLGMKAQDSFWIDSAKKFIRHAIALVRATNADGEPPTFADVGELAGSQAKIDERLLRFPEDHPSWRTAVFFNSEWTELAPETRSSIQAYITNMIDPFLMDPYVWLFGGRSTIRVPDVLGQGKILYVHMPIADKEAMSRVVNTFLKLEYYREVLKHPNKERASFFLCDEFQAFFTVAPGKGDADFFERSRQSRHANIIATQNLPALLKQLKEDTAPVMNLLGNCAVKMFLRNTDNTTNEYASNLFGQSLVMMQSTSSGGGGRGAGFGGIASFSSSQSAAAQYDQRVRKEVFTELAVPFRSDGIDFCESVVHLASRGQVAKQKLRWKVHPLES
ncbi:MAG: hypothetical protein QOD06_882 [Candidatus Binatota bacterium]|nr:hypothetical protein [Candidatus Binatota bacterium]